MKKLYIKAIAAHVGLVTSISSPLAMAGPTLWEFNKDDKNASSNKAKAILVEENLASKVEALPEFPLYDADTQEYRDAGSVHLYSNVANSESEMHTVGPVDIYCEKYEKFLNIAFKNQDVLYTSASEAIEARKQSSDALAEVLEQRKIEGTDAFELMELEAKRTALEHSIETKQNRMTELALASETGFNRILELLRQKSITEDEELLKFLDDEILNLKTQKSEIDNERARISKEVTSEEQERTTLLDREYFHLKANVGQTVDNALELANERDKSAARVRDAVAENSDAIEELNTTVNDLAKLQVGRGSGFAGLNKEEVAAAAALIGSAENGVSANIGEIENLSYKSEERASYSIPALILRSPQKQKQKSQIILEGLADFGKTQPGIDSSTDVAKDINASFNALTPIRPNADFLEIHNDPDTGHTTATVGVGLGTYCGRIDEEQVSDDGKTGLRWKNYDGQLATRVIPIKATYERTIAMRPTDMRCSFNSSKMAEDSLSIVNKSRGFLFWKKNSTDIKRHQSEIAEAGFSCNFTDVSNLLDEQREEAYRNMQMIQTEAFARWTQEMAEDYTVEQVSEEELKEWMKNNPKQNYSPTMMFICGGRPWCRIIVKSLKTIKHETTKGSSQTSGTHEVKFVVDSSKTYVRKQKNEIDGQMTLSFKSKFE